jgi:hypothetical protein
VLGLGPDDTAALNDDRVGRMLDRLFDADRASLITTTVVRAIREFDLDVAQLHNDSTTVTLTGAYPEADGYTRGGKATAAIRHGHNKDFRPDLKQLLMILTGVPQLVGIRATLGSHRRRSQAWGSRNGENRVGTRLATNPVAQQRHACVGVANALVKGKNAVHGPALVVECNGRDGLPVRCSRRLRARPGRTAPRSNTTLAAASDERAGHGQLSDDRVLTNCGTPV